MTKTNADCLSLLPDRRLGSLHRLCDVDRRRPRFRMGFELPYIVFSPRTVNWSLLFRHGFLLRGTEVRIIVARRERFD